jgi:hypothetical protein
VLLEALSEKEDLVVKMGVHHMEENMEVEAEHALLHLELADMELFFSNLVSD